MSDDWLHDQQNAEMWNRQQELLYEQSVLLMLDMELSKKDGGMRNEQKYRVL